MYLTQGQLAAAKAQRPRTPAAVQEYVRAFYRTEVPTEAVCEHHDAPFDYVVGSVLTEKDMELWTEKELKRYKVHDNCLVWANRGGGKTQNGGLTAHLRAKHHQGVGVRILGGSADQSSRMHEYVQAASVLYFPEDLRGDPSHRRTHIGASLIEIMTQSEKSVRGQHPQIALLDEVELFTPRIYRAAKLIPMSKGGYRRQLEQFSTLHEPSGIMAGAIDAARAAGQRVYTWCLWEVAERCTRPCNPKRPDACCRRLIRYDQFNEPHSFADVCRGRAKRSNGYYKLTDAQAAFTDVTYETFAAEMLCERPQRQDAIYPMLERKLHVQLEAGWYDPELPMIFGLDPGYRHPFAVWAQVDWDDTIIAVAEMHTGELTAADFSARACAMHKRLGFPRMLGGFSGTDRPEFINELNSPKYRSVMFLPERGVMCTSAPVQEGYNAVREKLLLKVDGEGVERPMLVFTPSVPMLYAQMEGLMSDVDRHGEPKEQQVKKDDHGPDALRYMVLGWKKKGDRLRITGRRTPAVAAAL